MVENEPAGTQVGAVRAIDADSGFAGQVWYFIAGSPDDADTMTSSERRHVIGQQAESAPAGLSRSEQDTERVVAGMAAGDEDVVEHQDAAADGVATMSASSLFSIDRQSGLISTSRVLDAEQTTEYQLLIVARDRGVPSLSSIMPVSCIVIHIQLIRPKNIVDY